MKPIRFVVRAIPKRRGAVGFVMQMAAGGRGHWGCVGAPGGTGGGNGQKAELLCSPETNGLKEDADGRCWGGAWLCKAGEQLLPRPLPAGAKVQGINFSLTPPPEL